MNKNRASIYSKVGLQLLLYTRKCNHIIRHVYTIDSGTSQKAEVAAHSNPYTNVRTAK